MATVISSYTAATIVNNNLCTTSSVKDDVTTKDVIGISGEQQVSTKDSRRYFHNPICFEQCLIPWCCSRWWWKIGPEDYFVFTDGISNGYCTQNNIGNYSDLPCKTSSICYIDLPMRSIDLLSGTSCKQYRYPITRLYYRHLFNYNWWIGEENILYPAGKESDNPTS